jgi:hypothetical protein
LVIEGVLNPQNYPTGNTLANFVITGTSGQFTCTSTTLYTGQPVQISGINIGGGSISSYVSGTTYYIATGGTGTSFVLLTSPSGSAATTTTGTPVGLTVVAQTIQWSGLNNATYGGQPSFAQVAPNSTNTPMVFDGAFTLSTTCGVAGAAIGAVTIPVPSTAGIAIGDDVFSSTVTDAFQGNTKVLSFVTNTSITVDKTLIKALASTNNVTISRNTYAVPGGTIFSFLNSPNGTDKLDLAQLKELTNTPIGGRGTFPNGPDVLMINVYITQGVPINSNLVLSWGEAQA